MSYEQLVQTAINNIDRAVVVKEKSGKVGTALLMKDGTVITGFNIESRAFPILHAEVVAVVSAIKMGYKNSDYVAIAIVCNMPGLFPACASCRQFLWEHTNPDLDIIAYDIESKNGQSFKLRDLYPLPFPAESFKKAELPDNEVVVKDGQEENEGIDNPDVQTKVRKRVPKGKA